MPSSARLARTADGSPTYATNFSDRTLDPLRRALTHLSLALLLALLVAGCASTPERRWTRSEVRDLNHRRLARLVVGMRQTVALDIMGHEIFTGASGGKRLADTSFTNQETRDILSPGDKSAGEYGWVDRPIRNPFRREFRKAGDGRFLEIYFYYAEPGNFDEKIDPEELAPVVFKDGLLVGLGWKYLEENYGWHPSEFK